MGLRILDDFGNMVLEKKIIPDEYDIMFQDAIAIPGTNEIILLGLCTSKKPFSLYEYDSFLFMKLDNQLNIITFKVEYIGSNYGFRHINHLIENDRILVVMSSDFAFLDHNISILDDQFETVFLKLNLNGDVVHSDILFDSQGSCQCIMPSPVGGYFCPGLSGYLLNEEFEFYRYEGLTSESPMSHPLSPMHFYNISETCFRWSGHNYLINNTFAGNYGNLKNGQSVLFIMSGDDFKIKKSIPIGKAIVCLVRAQ